MKTESVATPSPAPSPSVKPGPAPRKSRSLWIIWLLVVCVLAGVTALVIYRLRTAGATPSGRGARGVAGDIPVEAAVARLGRLPIYREGLLGTVTPIQTVTVHTRVDGELVKIGFTEGRIVKKGDFLAEIDPNPYKAVLMQAQGQLARDQAMLLNAQLDLKRFKQAPDAYTQQQIDTQQALVDQDTGIVASDQGTVNSAQVNLDYCTITSPVTGWVGIRQVDVGNIVHSSDANGIVVITQLQPITVIFPIQQDSINAMLGNSDTVPPLEATVLNGDHVLGVGKLVAIDSQVDITNAQVKLRAQFDNTDNALFPNQLVKVKLLINTLRRAVLIPSDAVQIGPDSQFVYVVKPDSTIEIRPVKTGDDGIDAGGDDVTTITSGLIAGETVVTVGVDNIREGAKVEVIKTTTRPTTRGSTTRPEGHVRRSLTNDSYDQGSPRTGQ